MTTELQQQKELEDAANALLAADIKENGFTGEILLDRHLRYRREKEIYSKGGVADGSRKGLFNRAAGSNPSHAD